MAVTDTSGANGTLAARLRNPGIDEYVEVQSIFSLVTIMVLTAVDFCG